MLNLLVYHVNRRLLKVKIDTNLMNVRSTKSSISLVRCSSICHSASPTELSLTNTTVCFPQHRTSYRVPPHGRHIHVGLILLSNTVLSSSFHRNLTKSISPFVFRGKYRWPQNAFSKRLYLKTNVATSFKVLVPIYTIRRSHVDSETSYLSTRLLIVKALRTLRQKRRHLSTK